MGKTGRKPQGVKVEGLISKRVIKLWLEAGASIETWDKVTNGTVNTIMLKAAIADLPPVLKVCLQYRWVDQLPRKEILARTGIPKTTYYRRCDKAVEFIYYHVNGMAAGLKDLLDKILVEKD